MCIRDRDQPSCQEEELLTQIYLGFLENKNTQRAQIPDLLAQLDLNLADAASLPQLAILVLAMCAASNYFKRFAQAIINTYFAPQED